MHLKHIMPDCIWEPCVRQANSPDHLPCWRCHLPSTPLYADDVREGGNDANQAPDMQDTFFGCLLLSTGEKMACEGESEGA